MRFVAGLGVCDQLLVVSALRSLCAVRLVVRAKNRARGLWMDWAFVGATGGCGKRRACLVCRGTGGVGTPAPAAGPGWQELPWWLSGRGAAALAPGTGRGADDRRSFSRNCSRGAARLGAGQQCWQQGMPSAARARAWVRPALLRFCLGQRPQGRPL